MVDIMRLRVDINGPIGGGGLYHRKWLIMQRRCPRMGVVLIGNILNLDCPIGEVHDDSLWRANPSLDLRNGAGRGCPYQPSWPTSATSLASVCEVLVHVLQKSPLEKGHHFNDKLKIM